MRVCERIYEMATRSVTKAKPPAKAAAATKAKATKAPAKGKATTKTVDEVVEELEIVEDSTETDEAPAIEEKPAKKGKAGKGKKNKDVEPEPDAEESDEKPKKKGPARPPIEFGSGWLVSYINEQCGTEYKAFDLRVLLRKMAKSKEIQRDVGEDRSRYEFTGPNDPVVKAVIKKVKAGDIDKAKKDSLAKLKESAAKKKGNKTKTKDKARKAKSKDEESEGVEEID